MVKPERFSVCLVGLEPTVGSEMKKTRPCVVISPDSMNKSRLNSLIIAPLTSSIRNNFPTRIDIEFDERKGQVALDQLRAIDRSRILKTLGKLKKSEGKAILSLLQIIFS